ncbi:MAG TPA: MGMT family protein, partial [Phycisphaerae bacterium]|nr:MGMT family protein [Phycisphaerae bacterium]
REAPRGLRLPCHRVIKADGALAPERIFGGRQKKLLLAEGVVVGPNGRVAMQKYEWDGAGGKRRRRGRA